MADKNKSEEYYKRPEKLGAWEGTKQFLYNKESGEVMGRTSGSWGRILLFYLIFYAVLAIFFFVYWLLFASTLIDGRPKYELTESRIGDNPGLGFRPMPPESNVESTLIWYQKNTPNNSKYWVDEINHFLETFNQTSSNTVDCTDGKEEGKSCKVDLAAFYPCISKTNYGYQAGQPCIFLKLNKIYKWQPDYYTERDVLPNDMPEPLKNHINGRNNTKKSLEVVWVSCEGENPADIENLGKNIDYKSLKGEQGFHGHYFPFMNTEGYLQPLVAVQFLSVKPGVLINIECKAWAKNIKHDRQDRKGSVHFELMIDELSKPQPKKVL